MTFYREGKKCNYYEVIETLSTLVNKEILINLEEKEVEGFFVRIMDFTNEVITQYLKRLDYKVISLRQSFITLEQMKMVTMQPIWEQAIDLNEAIKRGVCKHSELVEFISTSLIEAMKELDLNLNRIN